MHGGVAFPAPHHRTACCGSVPCCRRLAYHWGQWAGAYHPATRSSSHEVRRLGNCLGTLSAAPRYATLPRYCANMLAGCPPAGSTLLAPRLLLLPTASPICFSAKGFERNRRYRNALAWRLLFSEGMYAQVLSRPLQSRGKHDARASPPGGTRCVLPYAREEVSTVSPATPHAVPAHRVLRTRQPPYPKGRIVGQGVRYAVGDGRPGTDCAC